MKRKAKIYYVALDDFWRKEEKLNWLNDNPIFKIEFDRIEPDDKHNWINQTDNDFETLLPLVSKEVKRGKAEEAIFELFSLGVVTAKDEWSFDFEQNNLLAKSRFLCEFYTKTRKSGKIDEENSVIKWTSELKDYLLTNTQLKFDKTKVRLSSFRPFTKKYLYFDKIYTHRTYQNDDIFGIEQHHENKVIAFLSMASSHKLSALASTRIIDAGFLKQGNGITQCVSLYRYDSENQKHENITDWALNQFQTHYKEANGAQITKQDIFYYVYAVLHSPVYRKKYEQNLKREFPRLPFYANFFEWKRWGAELMDLHINYETVEPFALERNDLKKKPKQAAMFASEDDNAFEAKPQTKLRADKANGTITIDSITMLSNVPPTAWEYKLGNRSAIEWILDQYKEKTPQDATIRERFNAYKFADYKEQVIDLIKRVTTVSVRTMEIINQMPNE